MAERLDPLQRLSRSRLAAPLAVSLAIIVLAINEIGYDRVRQSTVVRDEEFACRL